MQSKKILVTGGAGFIGSFLVDRLVEEKHEVIIFDSLEAQVHPKGKPPEYLNSKADFIKGNVKDKQAVTKVLEGVQVLFHYAGAVGIGQSMYEIEKYVNSNVAGTANILDSIVNSKNSSIEKMILPASMSSYGEGLYECEDCGIQNNVKIRSEESIKKSWEPVCENCRKPLTAIPTAETKTQNCGSIYSLTKKAQEDMFLMIGERYGIPAVALRYFIVFGPRQSLSNPYTGVTAIFASRIKNDSRPVVFEDGKQTRDFVSVHDVVEANLLAMGRKSANFERFNVGSGKPIEIKEVAEQIAQIYNSKIKPEVTLNYRKGDIRHCFADISKIKSKLEWTPRKSFKEGIQEIKEWSEKIKAVDNFEKANKELKEKGWFV